MYPIRNMEQSINTDWSVFIIRLFESCWRGGLPKSDAFFLFSDLLPSSKIDWIRLMNLIQDFFQCRVTHTEHWWRCFLDRQRDTYAYFFYEYTGGKKCIRQVQKYKENQNPGKEVMYVNQFHTYRLRLQDTRIRIIFKTVTVSHPPPACQILLSMLRFPQPSYSVALLPCLFLRRITYPPPRSLAGVFASVIIKSNTLLFCFLHLCLCIYKQKKKKKI